MGRVPNHISTVQITISTTPPLKKLLEKLVSTGLYGKSAADAAERLIAREIERLLSNRVIDN
jgi:hypothetical protein